MEPFSFNFLEKLPAVKKLPYVEEHLDEIEAMTSKQKDQIATLLCKASTPLSKLEHPIIGDKPMNPQEVFEELAPFVGAERAAAIAAHQESVWQ